MKLEQAPPPERVLSELRPALKLIHSAIETGIQQTVEYFNDLGVGVDNNLAPNIVRYHARRHLDENDLPSEIDVDCERKQLGNNGILIQYGAHQLRVLKSDNGRPPVPGASKAKRTFYQQGLPFIGVLDPNEPLKPLRLLALWDAVPKSYAFQGLSLALPKGGGETRESVQWHWLVDIDEAVVTAPNISISDDNGSAPAEDLPVRPRAERPSGTQGHNYDHRDDD